MDCYDRYYCWQVLDTGDRVGINFGQSSTQLGRADEKEEESFFPKPEHFDYLECENVPEKGRKITININGQDDLDITLMKSNAASFIIPELDLDNPPSVGRFATVQDFLVEAESALRSSYGYYPQYSEAKARFGLVLERLEQCISGNSSLTIIIDDPLSLSQVIVNNKLITSNTPNIQIQSYDRSFLQNEEFGQTQSLLPQNQITDPTLAYSQLSHLLNHSSHVVLLTGAGVSTESGIPAFRGNEKLSNLAGKSAIWDQFNPLDEQFENFINIPQSRLNYWTMHAYLDSEFAKAKPNSNHFIAKWLSDNNKLSAVLTQNIDGLYQAAGVPKDKVVELHGTRNTVKCFKGCGALYETTEVLKKMKDERMLEKGETPLCEKCKVGILKPNTISFGQRLEEEVIRKAENALENECDLLLIMGTSLVVSPVNTLPGIVVNKKNVPVVMMNMSPTKYDEFANVVLREPSGGIMAQFLSTCS